MDNFKINVLIVDDDPETLSKMKVILERKNCHVKCASTFEEALSFLVNEIFHITFVECVLRTGQGTKLACEAYKILGQSVDIFLMSGIVSEESVSGFVDKGVSGFIPKPVAEKEIDVRLSLIREKIAYGETKNLLVRLFSEGVSSIQKTKLLISKKSLSGIEFLFCLNQALYTEDPLSITFTTRNKQHCIFCYRGNITHYENRRPESFKRCLLQRGLVLEDEVGQLEGLSQRQIEEVLLKDCILSTAQLSEIKHEMFMKAISEIMFNMRVSFDMDISSFAKQGFAVMSCDEYEDWAIDRLNTISEDDLFPLLDKDMLGKNLVFQEGAKNKKKVTKDSTLNDLKEGEQLGKACEKRDMIPFWIHVFGLILKKEALFASSGGFGFTQLYERYRRLDKFISQFSDPHKLFSYFTGNLALKAKPNEIKQAWLYFIKQNHPDKFSFDLPPDLVKMIETVYSKVKYFHDKSFDNKIKTDEKEKQKQEKIQRELYFSEKKKIYERYMEKGDYKKAISVINTVPEKVMEKDPQWQLLWLWMYFENKSEKDNIWKKKSNRYMKNIDSQANQLKSEKMYYYILGLFSEGKDNWDSALKAFEMAKKTDPSFQPCYPAIHRCSLKKLEKRQEKNILSVLKNFDLKNLGKKAKKAG